MSVEQSQPMEAAEPKAGKAFVPIWLIILSFLLLYWGMVYFDQHGGWFKKDVYLPSGSIADVERYQPPPGDGCNMRRGKEVYEQICGLCHQNDGNGDPTKAPPLAGSEWVLGNVNRLVRIPQLGLNGPITVKGQKVQFPAGMAAMGATLSNDDLANVLCYIRQSWGNKGGEVTEDQVAAARKEIGGQAQAVTEADLLKIPEK